jgi:hypothetical protein
VLIGYWVSADTLGMLGESRKGNRAGESALREWRVEMAVPTGLAALASPSGDHHRTDVYGITDSGHVL